jgi:hypothetical protein
VYQVGVDSLILEEVFLINPFFLPCLILWPTEGQGFPVFGFLNLTYRNMARLVRWGIIPLEPLEFIYLDRKILNQKSPSWKTVHTSDGMATLLSSLPLYSKVLIWYGDPVGPHVFTIQ